MSIASPIEAGLQQSVNDIQVIDDDIVILPDAAPAAAISKTASLSREPLLPFLILGVVSLLAIFAVAVLLAL